MNTQFIDQEMWIYHYTHTHTHTILTAVHSMIFSILHVMAATYKNTLHVYSTALLGHIGAHTITDFFNVGSWVLRNILYIKTMRINTLSRYPTFQVLYSVEFHIKPTTIEDSMVNYDIIHSIYCLVDLPFPKSNYKILWWHCLSQAVNMILPKHFQLQANWFLSGTYKQFLETGNVYGSIQVPHALAPTIRELQLNSMKIHVLKIRWDDQEEDFSIIYTQTWKYVQRSYPLSGRRCIQDRLHPSSWMHRHA